MPRGGPSSPRARGFCEVGHSQRRLGYRSADGQGVSAGAPTAGPCRDRGDRKRGRRDPGAFRHGLGWDAHAYYVSWTDSLYDATPGHVDAFNYSPAFAQAVWPLTQLPLPAFCLIFVGAAGAGIAWLLRPLHRTTGAALWFAFLP